MLKKISILMLFAFTAIGLAYLTVPMHPFYPNFNSIKDFQYQTYEEKKEFLDGTPFVLDGQWDFFADRWVISDQYTGESDGQIAFSERSEKKFIDSDDIPYHRFASYKYTVSAESFLGDVIIIMPYRHNCSYRVFINKQLVCQQGEMVKGETNLIKDNALKQLNEFHIGFGYNLDVVIETFSAGGKIMDFTPILSTANNFNSELLQIQEWQKNLSLSIWILSRTL